MLWTNFALIPTALYRQEDEDLWVNFLQEHVHEGQQLVRHEISGLECMCVYEDNQQIGDEHIILNIIIRCQQIDALDKIVVWREDEHTAICLFKSGQLTLANIYQTAEAADVLYYLLKIYEQYTMSNQATHLYVHADETTCQLIDTYLLFEAI